jgi:hypothetical protein
MSAILGGIENFYRSTKSSATAIQYSKMQDLSLGGVPLLTYGLIGITTIVLATITIFESTDKEDDSSDSMTSQLPTLSATAASLNPFTPTPTNGTAESEKSIIPNFSSSPSSTNESPFKMPEILDKPAVPVPVPVPEPEPQKEEALPKPAMGGKKKKTRGNKSKNNKTKKQN